MSAGRHGGHRDSEFRVQESEIDGSRGRDLYFSKGEKDHRFRYRETVNGSGRYQHLDRGKDHNHARERKQVGDQEMIRVRHRDLKEREANGSGYHSTSSASNSGSSGSYKRGRLPTRGEDREPGELSSGSGSEEVEGYEQQVRLQIRDDELHKCDSGVSEVNRKRKYSPIVWDRVEKQTGIEARGKPVHSVRDSSHLSDYSQATDVASTPLPPLPPLLRGYRTSPHLSSTQILGPKGSDSVPNYSFGLLVSPTKLSSAPGSVESAASESPVRGSPNPPQEQHRKNFPRLDDDRNHGIYTRTQANRANDQEPGQLVENSICEDKEEYVPTLNISASRWADEVSDNEGAGRRKKSMPTVELEAKRILSGQSIVGKLTSQSPELGEFMAEGFDGECAKSFGSDEEGSGVNISGECDGTASEGEDLETDLEMEDHMDIDGEDADGGDVGHQSEIDYKEKNGSMKSPNRIQPPLRTINMLQGCRSVDEFESLNRINEGTYGIVYRAKDKKTGEILALKKVKMEKEREGFPMTSLREINILLSFHHPSIVDVKEVVVGNNLDSIFMVMEYMEHDLKGLMEAMKQPFSQSEVKCLMLQLFEGVKYLHDNWVLHRDLKTSNLLLNNRGELKICDFGLARQYGSPLKPYTHLVVTLWYRAPELLLGAKQYSTAIDMWSLGCIMAEFLAKEPLFSGKTELDQLDKIFRTLGTPSEKIWPGFVNLPGVKVKYVKQPYNKLRDKFPPTSFSGRPSLSEAGFDLLNKLLTYDPEKRITAEDALNHEWFREVPLPKSKDFMPTFPAQHAQDRRLRRIMKSPDPLEEQRRKELLQGDELGTGSLFG